MVTSSPSTMTGTARRPLLCTSMRASAAASFLTLKYSNDTCRRWKSSRAACVYGQVSLPKIETMRHCRTNRTLGSDPGLTWVKPSIRSFDDPPKKGVRKICGRRQSTGADFEEFRIPGV